MCDDKVTGKNTKFTEEEDKNWFDGIQMCGKKAWSRISKDKRFQFFASLTRHSQRVRAATNACLKTDTLRE